MGRSWTRMLKNREKGTRQKYHNSPKSNGNKTKKYTVKLIVINRWQDIYSCHLYKSEIVRSIILMLAALPTIEFVASPQATTTNYIMCTSTTTSSCTATTLCPKEPKEPKQALASKRTKTRQHFISCEGSFWPCFLPLSQLQCPCTASWSAYVIGASSQSSAGRRGHRHHSLPSWSSSERRASVPSGCRPLRSPSLTLQTPHQSPTLQGSPKTCHQTQRTRQEVPTLNNSLVIASYNQISSVK